MTNHLFVEFEKITQTEIHWLTKIMKLKLFDVEIERIRFE